MVASDVEPDAALGGRVVIVGSINVDLVVRVDRFPESGETRLAERVSTHLGGKGLSQAITAARFGSPCSLIGITGHDDNAARVRAALAAAGVDGAGLRTSEHPTGQAFVWVDGGAENKIAVVPGANAHLHDLTAADLDLIASSRVLLTQLESGLDIAVDAVLAARDAGVTVVLNAAPAQPLPDAVLRSVDLLVVNEIEVLQLEHGETVDLAGAALSAKAAAVLVTLGARGGRLYRAGAAPLDIGAPTVTAVDTTGAGDVSCGVIAAALAQGESLEDAVSLAFAAAALAVQVEGNASAIPDRAQVLGLARVTPSA